MQIYNFFSIFAADMKKKTLLIAFFTGIALALHAEGAWKERTTAALDSLLSDSLFESTQVALAVWDLTDDSLLYATGYRQRMRPASCQKIITAVTALKALGADFQYRPYVKEAGWGWCWDDKISQPKSPGAPLLNETELQRVDEVMLPMLKESDNLLAESMFQQLADRSGKRGAGRREAAAEVERLMRELSLEPKDYLIADGSGLSLYDYVTVELLHDATNAITGRRIWIDRPEDSAPPLLKNEEKNNTSIINNPPASPPRGSRVRKKAPEAPNWKPERFAGFWQYYPIHTSKQAAIRAWDQLKPGDELIARIGKALRRQMATDTWQRGVGIPYAATYLNQRRWEDDPEPKVPATQQRREVEDVWL